jgi:hypothetical protein
MSDRDFAVVIGIRDYVHLRALDGAVEDAKNVSDWLLTLGEVPETHLHFVTGDALGTGEPALPTIEAAFDQVLDAARAEGARRLYVYFAGHGLSEAVSRLSLLAADARAENLGRALDSHGYQDALGNLPLFPEQIFWYDCCRFYDQRAAGQSPTWSRETPQPPPNLKQLVHYAAGFNDAANERPHFGTTRGFFTRALLEGLGGAAARIKHGTGVVVAGDLGRFVTARVEQMAREAHLSQIPEPRYLGDPESFVIVESVPPAAQRVKVIVGAEAGELCVRDSKLTEISRQVIGDRDEAMILDLVPGLYLIERQPQCCSELIHVQPTVYDLVVDLSSA